MPSASNAPGLAFPKTPRHVAAVLTSAQRYEQFRNAVWERDKHRSRATGQPLVRRYDPTITWEQRGEVCHLAAKGAHPAQKYDPSNAILLSAQQHFLSDARGNHRLLILDPETGEKATDAGTIECPKPILFVMRDKQGRELWRRTR